MRGKRLERGIYRRGKVFDVRISVGPRGTRHELSRTFKTLPEARLFLDAWRRDRQFETAGLKAPETRRPRLTLKEILNAYLEESRALGSDPETIRAFAFRSRIAMLPRSKSTSLHRRSIISEIRLAVRSLKRQSGPALPSSGSESAAAMKAAHSSGSK